MIEIKDHFNLGSFLPLFLSILGLYNIFFFLNNEFGKGFLVMLFSFIVYISNNFILNLENKNTIFNKYLEETSSFLSFGLTTVIFGFIIYKNNIYFLLIISLYTISIILFQARNWLLEVKNTEGYPLVLNGLFFPLFYYIIKIYYNSNTFIIFIIFYIIISILSITNINFFKEIIKSNNEIEN